MPVGPWLVASLAERVLANVAQVIVGKDSEISLCLIALICDGHLLIEDVPGVGKTMLAKALARSLDCGFSRVQFTPDLLPSDITGVRAFNQKHGDFEFMPGPVFTQILLVDEINRATPKTQAALLEAMEERQVTIDGQSHLLPQPFLVLATQNPLEHAGTFPLPEAQLDRFLMRVRLGYLDSDQEMALLGRFQNDDPLARLSPVADAGGLQAAQRAAREVFVHDSVKRYLISVVEATRNHPDVGLGASTRASLGMFRAVQVKAAMEGREYVLPDDVKGLAESILAHRLLLRPGAEMRGLKSTEIIAQVLAGQPIPQLPRRG